ncbi:MAG TPA: trypsin-like peptidase domain-containing protein [Pirellulaceae bacterium]|nr:trypsin-like peptidase domain-containing protein [Pirellulaceae bacterium]
MPQPANSPSAGRHYRRLLQARERPPIALEGAGGGLESLEVATDADLSDAAIKDRLSQAGSSLSQFVRKELGGDPRLQSIVDEIVRQGDAALRALRDDESQLDRNPQLMAGLEAIARTDGSRPSFLIRDGQVDPASSPIGAWADRLAEREESLRQAIACVGRVNLGIEHRGTGFLIQENLIVTNRHVLQEIADPSGNGTWTFRPPGAWIDFGHEHRGRASVNRRALARVIFAGKLPISRFSMDHGRLDLALIELGPGDPAAAPQRVLSVLAMPAWDQPQTAIFAVGYPGAPPRHAYPATLLEQLFQSTFGHKRLAPGELLPRESTYSDWTLGHDATTLGGNSGSALLVVGNEMVAAGLHYGGLPQVGPQPGTNWGHVLGLVLGQTDGVRSQTLGEILRQRGVEVLDGGNSAPREAARTPSPATPMKERMPAEPAPSPVPALSVSAAPSVAKVTASAASGVYSWTVPLQVTISLGQPTPSARITGAPSKEGLFGPSVPLAEVAARFSADSLAATQFSWETALSLALASKLAYSPAALVHSTGLSDWRLATCAFFEESDTQCFVASTPAAAFVAFRGTESLGDWLADLNVASIRRPYGVVHRGFYFAYQVIQAQLEQALAAVGSRPLLLTGHSLGAALATIAAAELHDRWRIAGIYTYGQPRVGFSSFVSFFNQRFGTKLYRFVNDDDIVPRIPPGYQHVGRLFHFTAQGSLESTLESAAPGLTATELPPLTDAEFDQLRSELLATRASRKAGARESLLPTPALEGFFPSISDHSMDEYIPKIARQIR